MNFSDKILRLMSLNNKSQVDVGSAVGVSQQAVSNWLKGAVPRKTVIIKLAQFFNVPEECLLNDELDIPDKSGKQVKKRRYPEKFYTVLKLIRETVEEAEKYGVKSPHEVIDSIEEKLRKLVEEDEK
jgi:transcriptional regulator with XRE-family HTH domain